MEEFQEFSRVDPETERDAMAMLRDHLAEATALERQVADLEATLSAAKRSLHILRTDRIPSIMEQFMLDSLSFDGWRVDLRTELEGSLPKDDEKRPETIGRRARAVEWLEKNDGAGIIQTVVTVEFPRDQHERALKVERVLMAQGYVPQLQSTVHHSTLKAFARERLESGAPIDLETIGLNVVKIAKIKPPKG